LAIFGDFSKLIAKLKAQGLSQGGCPWCSSTLLATEFLRKRLAKLTAEHPLTLPGQRSLL